MKLLGINAGSKGGNTHILLAAAAEAASNAGHDVELVWLDGLVIPSGPDSTEVDHAWWLWDKFVEADAWLIAAPIYIRTIPGRLKVIADRLMGPNADWPLIEEMLRRKAEGIPIEVPFRIDERVLRPRVAGFIAVGGALTPQWKTLALPALHMLTHPMQVAIVDQQLVEGAGTSGSVLVLDGVVERSRLLGQRVVSQMGKAFDEVEYLGPEGLCPKCHLSVISFEGDEVACATCGARGVLREGRIAWTNTSPSILNMSERLEHFEEIQATAKQQRAQSAEIQSMLTQFPTDAYVTP
ncbi:MAG: hypothetical protein RJB01_1642 [Actinomycetota bacterium]